MTVLGLAAVGLLVFSIALVFVGLRGRRVDDHPVCRRCRFDLFGAAPGSASCPECGADVTLPRAVRVGNRVRRHRMLAVAVTLLLVAVMPLAVVGWANFRGVDFTRYRLASSVIRDVNGPDAVSRAALRELTRRVAAGGLSDAQVNDLADRALARQADRSKPWVHRWGEFLEAAYDAGRLDEDRWAQYLGEVARFGLVLRPEVRRGDPIPLTIQGGHVRVGRDGRFLVHHAAPDVYVLPDVLLGRDPGGAAGRQSPLNTGHGTGTWSDSAIRPKAGALARLSNGPHVARAVFDVMITDSTSSARPFSFKVDLTGPFTLLPGDQPSVTVNRDPAVTAKFQQAISVTSVWSAGGSASVMYGVGDLPFGQPFSVWLRAGDREWQLGSILVSGGGANMRLMGLVTGFDPARVDVVFRPDVNAAKRSTYVGQIWEGDVVIPDVAVEYPQGQQKPQQQQKQQPRADPPETP